MTMLRILKIYKYFWSHFGVALFTIFLGYLIAARVSSRIMIPDQACYFAYSASLISDGDLQFYDEFQSLLMPQRYVFATPTCYLENLFSPGAALLWLPFQLVALPLNLQSDASDPTTAPHSRIAAAVGSQVLGVLAALFMFKALITIIDKKTAILTLLLMIPGSSFLHYWLKDPLMAHIPSLLLTSVIIRHWLRDSHIRPTFHFGSMGVLIGFAFLIRNQNALLLILPLGDLVGDLIHRKNPFKTARTALALGGGFILIAQSQLVSWAILYGNALSAPASGNLDWAQLHVRQVLFSAYHGVVAWTPILVISFFGVILFCLKRPGKGIPLLLVLSLQFVLIAACRQWWMGNSFGSRILLDYLPLFAIGFAFLLMHPHRTQILIIGTLSSLWTFQLFLNAFHNNLELGRYVSYRELVTIQGKTILEIPSQVLSLLEPGGESSPLALICGVSLALLAFFGHRVLLTRASPIGPDRILGFMVVILIGLVMTTELVWVLNPNPLPQELCQLITKNQWLPFPQRIRVTAAVGEAQYYIRTGNHDGAILRLEDALSNDPTNYEALSEILAIFLASGRSSDACRHAESAVIRYPNDSALMSHAIQAFSACGRTKDALGIAMRLLSSSPNDPLLLIQTAELASRNGDDGGATRLLTRIASLDSLDCPTLRRALDLALQIRDPQLVGDLKQRSLAGGCLDRE